MAVNERELVLDMLLKWKEGVQGQKILKEGLDNLLYLEKTERAFISRLFEGCMEKRLYLDYVLSLFLKTPITKLKPLILAVLRLSAYQILFMDRVPDSAAVNEAVKLVKKRGLASLSGFVNGVLRTVSREKEKIRLPKREENEALYLSLAYSIPLIIVERFLKDYGEETEAILKSFDEEKPLSVRINDRKTTEEALIKRLREEGVEAKRAVLPKALRLSSLDSLAFLESFEEGDFFVQDESSQLIGFLSGVKKGDFVLDLCAAPGGKTALLSFLVGEEGSVWAFDLSETKRSLILENVERLGLSNVKTEVNDASLFREDLKERAAVILCDLPCSGLGVMGKKKDIRYHFSEEKVRDLALLQKEILRVAVSYLKPGGRLIFSTCTMTKEENEENFIFLSKELGLFPQDFSLELPEELRGLSSGVRYMEEARRGYIRILPHDFGSDGFFISRFIRKK